MIDPEYTDADAKAIIEDEGLDYAVRHYCDAANFKNAETRKLWAAAEKACAALAEHVGAEV